MRKRTRTSNGRKKLARSSTRKPLVLDEGLRQMIRGEATKLKLSEEEYLRLMTHFSEVVRTSMLPAGVLDGGFLTMILQNPMVLEMLKGMIQNLLSGAMNKSQSVRSDSRGGMPNGAWPAGPQGPGPQAPPPYGPRQGIRPPQGGYGGGPPGLGSPQGMGVPNGVGGPRGFGGPGMWGMPPRPQQGQEAPVAEREAQTPDGDGGTGDGTALDMDAIARMVGQFLQK